MSKNSFAVQQLLVKMKSSDPDLKFMALTDLISDINRSGDAFGVDDGTEHQAVEQVLALMNDQNGEVKNLAVKTLAALVKKVTEGRTQIIIDRLVGFAASKDEVVRDIASLGLKTVVAEIPAGSPLANTACVKLAPKIVAQLENSASSADHLIDSLDLLSDLLSRFESTVKTMVDLQVSVLKAATPLLGNGRAAVRKRAVGTLAILIASSDASLFDTLASSTVLVQLKTSDKEKVKTAVLLIGALAKTAPARVGKKVTEFTPLILKVSRSDDDELREIVLQTLESLALKCPTELGPFISEVVEAGTAALKHDPNYAGGADDDEDTEMGAASDDEDNDDDFGDEYSDDDDTSWKVRRGATKLLSACISTRSDLLGSFYKTISPSLIDRFGEREETVKVEIWATYTALLSQTKVYGSGGTSSDSNSNGGRLKRKRSSDKMEIEEGPIALLRAQTPSIAKSIIKQLTAKSPITRQAGFALLHELISVVDGALETQIPGLISRIETALKASDSGLSGAATSLKIEVLSFLGLFFRTHSAKTFSDELSKLIPLLVAALRDKFNKIAAEAFLTSSDLVKVLRPLLPTVVAISSTTSSQIQAIYNATMDRLSSTDADEEVKGKGIMCLGVLLYHVGDELEGDFSRSLGFLRDRLKNEVSRIVTVKVVGEVAASPICKGNSFEEWIQECLVEVSTLLRKVNRPLKVAAFACISALLARSGEGLPTETAKALVSDLEPLVNDEDINLLPMAIHTIASLLQQSPSSLKQIQSSILPKIYKLVQSPLLQGPSQEALLVFFKDFVGAGAKPLDLVKTLAESANNLKKIVDDESGTQVGMQSLVNSSRCIGVILRESPDVAEGIVSDYATKIQSSKTLPAMLILGLLTLGEIGRSIDFSSHPKTFNKIIDHFGAASEDVRRSAAFAAGNIAVGNPSAFLPRILELIQTNDKKRYLALQALKEVIVHSPATTLAEIGDSLWTPLFENCQDQEEGTRNVAADCLGQLTVTNPAKYLPQLQARLASDSRHTRATVIAAIRFTFTNDSTSYDELLAPLIVEFFKLIHDSDIGVRRLALSSLNSAAHNKPHLVRDHLSSLLPELYGQTKVDETLIRIVEMGPFKHKVDDGLDIRKTAYETMHTLLDTCLKEIEIHEYLKRVLAGLNDDEEVKKLCYLMLVKLATIAPTAVTQRLDDSVTFFATTLDAVLKDNAVKQETERLAELQKASLRCLATLNRLASVGNTPKFSTFIQTVSSGKFSNQFKELSSSATTSRIGDRMDID